MELSLTDKNVLITGSTRGIGFEIAKRFHEEGCNVIINGRNKYDLDKAQSKLRGSRILCLDFGNHKETEEKVKLIMDKIKSLDILVCNVGNGKSVQPGNENYYEWQNVFSANLWPTTNAIESCKKYMKRDSGSIICISSICGLEVINGAPITYSVAKAALNAYVKGISRPLGKDGIRINAIAPGNILFEGSTWQHKLDDNPEIVEKMLKNNVTLNTFGRPIDIANLVLYLSSPISNFVTGSIFTLDGGQIH